MRSAIYGAGSLGTVLGAYLSKAGVQTELVNRNRAQVDALNLRGAHVTGGVEMTEKVRAVTPEEMRGPYDVIVLMTKQSDNESIARFLLPLLAEDGVLCTAQNGLPELKLAGIMGEDRVIGCAVVWGATLTEPGVAKLTSRPDSMSFQIGSLSGIGKPQLQKVKTLLEHMCPVVIEENFIGARFSKLLLNSAFSGLSVILGMKFGEIVDDRKTRDIAQRIIKECIDVAKASDIRITPVQGKDIAKLMDYRGPVKKKIANVIIPAAMRGHRDIRSGMLGDIERGRKAEIDAVNGVICEFGKRFGQKTPFNDRVIEIVHKIEEKVYAPTTENIRLFDDLI